MPSPLDIIIHAATEASRVILEIYEQEVVATSKADGSPVTIADQRAEDIILQHLGPFGLPVVAEESVAAGHIPVFGDDFFLVDPLDGTKEFLKRNGEFTVNIALQRRGRPSIGVIVAPSRGVTYWGGPDGAFSAMRGQKPQPIKADASGPLRIVASRSHGYPQTRTLIERLDVVEDVTVGSSLKFGLLASGVAQLYPRFGPTCEWDTAAGQAILEAAGGVVLDLDGRPLNYGHADRKFLNPSFVAAADRDLALRTVEEIRRIAS